jgi:hypothetical protein
MCACRQIPSVLLEQPISPIINLVLTLVCNTHLVYNKYVIAKLVELLYLTNQAGLERLWTSVINQSLATEYLVAALMKFYAGTVYTVIRTSFICK